MAPRVSIVVVSFNTRDLLRSCLRSVADNSFPPPDPETTTSIEVIVVDNGSSDGSAMMVETEFPRVHLIKAEQNLGFARATNLGLKLARGDFLMLLNPDAEVIGDAISELVRFLEEHKGVGCAGPSLLYGDGRFQHAAFHFPTLPMTFLDFFPLHHRLLNSPLNGRYRVPRDGQPFPIDHPLGAAMMIRRETLDAVGTLDEGFFIYCEEVDWCIRAKRAGWRIYQVPRAVVVHHGGQSTAQFKEAMLVELHRSRNRLFRKHYHAGFLAIHRAITRLWIATETIRSRRRAARGEITEAELTSRLRAYKAIGEL